MKKKLFLLLFVLVFITSCGNAPSTPNTVPEKKAEDTSSDKAKEPQVEEDTSSTTTDTTIDPKLTDIDAMKEYLYNNNDFGLYYAESNGINLTLDKYRLEHVDFTNDGKLDTILITWVDETDYLTPVFISLVDGKYQFHVSQLHGTKDDSYYMEDGLLFQKDTSNASSYATICTIEDHKNWKNVLMITSTYTFVPYPENTVTSSSKLVYLPPAYTEYITTLTKIDGYKNFKLESKEVYYDEMKTSHVLSHMVKTYTLDSSEYTIIEELIEDKELHAVVKKNFIIGSNDRLKDYTTVLEETKSIKSAIDYYIQNRFDFSKESRIAYVTGLNQSLDTLSNMGTYMDEGYNVLHGNVLFENDEFTKATLTVSKKPSILAYTAELFSPALPIFTNDLYFDASSLTSSPSPIEFVFTCIDPAYSAFIRTMQVDYKILMDNEDFFYQEDTFVDEVYKSIEQIQELYSYDSNILVASLSDVKTILNSTPGKATLYLIPKTVEYTSLDDIQAEKEDSLYAKKLAETKSIKSTIDYYIDSKDTMSKEDKISYLKNFIGDLYGIEEWFQYNAGFYPEKQTFDENTALREISFREEAFISESFADLFQVGLTFFTNGATVSEKLTPEAVTAENLGYYTFIIEPSYSEKIDSLLEEYKELTDRYEMFYFDFYNTIERTYTTLEDLASIDTYEPTIKVASLDEVNEIIGNYPEKATIVLIPSSITYSK